MSSQTELPKPRPDAPDPEQLTYRQAVRAALEDEMSSITKWCPQLFTSQRRAAAKIIQGP